MDTAAEVVIAGNGDGTTLFDCSLAGTDSLAYRATLFDPDGAPIDCGIWGNRPAGPRAFPESPCFCFDNDGDCSN